MTDATRPLTVAVTGPTGEIGLPFMRALEHTPEVGRIVALARRPFEPLDFGWKKTEYHQGDILDRAAVGELARGADVVVHLAFIVVKASAASADINIEGSRNVFEASAAAGVPRLVYTSSVAAYGYDTVEGLLTEDSPTEGSERHAYSHQKAEVEGVLHRALAGSSTEAYIFRPCIVAGPEAPALLEQLPSPITGCPSNWSTMTTWPRPWWLPCWAGERPGCTTSPRQGRSGCPTWRGSSAGTRSPSPGRPSA
jgi:nucleoside-diphosphate-sugar epimerase